MNGGPLSASRSAACSRLPCRPGAAARLSLEAGHRHHPRGRRQSPRCRRADHRRPAGADLEAAGADPEPAGRGRADRGAGGEHRRARRLHPLHDAGLDLHRAAGDAGQVAVRSRQATSCRSAWSASSRSRSRSRRACRLTLPELMELARKTPGGMLRRHQSRRAIASDRRVAAGEGESAADLRACLRRGGLDQRRVDRPHSDHLRGDRGPRRRDAGQDGQADRDRLRTAAAEHARASDLGGIRAGLREQGLARADGACRHAGRDRSQDQCRPCARARPSRGAAEIRNARHLYPPAVAGGYRRASSRASRRCGGRSCAR